jgi:PPE-repeat protein
MMAAASAWDTLAGQLSSFARGYSSAVSGLQGQQWAGPAAAAMATAAAPYAQWAASTGVRAEQAASQLRAATAAFETAHAAITPPAVVAANRSELADLMASNVLGQNAARIAAVEAAYQAMWAQNMGAMYGYAGSASSATKLSPFTQAPQTTNPAGQPATAASAAAATSGASNAQMLAAVPPQLSAGGTPQGIPVPQSLVSNMDEYAKLRDFADGVLFDKLRSVGSISHATLAWVRIASDGAFYAPLSGGLTSVGLTGSASPAALTGGTAGPAVGAGVDRAVLASAGEAATMGQLSVPQAWASATPVAGVHDQLSLMAKGVWETAPKVNVAGAGAASAMAPLAQAALAKKFKRLSVSTILQVTPPRYKMPRPSSGG